MKYPATWIESTGEAASLIERLCELERYAIDTEFKRENSFAPELCLVQLGWEENGKTEIALLDMTKVEATVLQPLFASNTLAVLHAGSQDMDAFRSRVGSIPTRFVDTQSDLRFLGYVQIGLAGALQSLLNVQTSKGAQLLDWARRPLRQDALDYAAQDVAHLLDLYEELEKRIDASGRSAWVAEERAAEQARAAAPRRPRSRAWWKLKGASKFRGKQRGVAQAVASWREAEAERRDKPIKRILSDLAVLSIAGRPPRNKKDLGRVRGAQLSNADANALFAVIEKGAAMSADELDLPPQKPKEKLPKGPLALINVFLQQVSDEEKLDPALVAKRADVESFLRDGSGPLSEGWRRELVGARMQRLLAGEIALALQGERLEFFER